MLMLKAYRSLTAEQKKILSDKRLTMNRPVDEILAVLRPLAECDTLADKARTKLGCTFGLSIVAMIAVAIIFANAGWSWVATAVMVVVAVILLGSGYLWSWTKRVDVSNNFRQFALPVLTVFREDFDSSHPVHLDLDLSSPTAASKKQSESAPYKEGAYYKIIDTMYADPWMKAEAVLVDGSRLSWTVSDTIRERKKTKRNPRGKIKTKTKYSKKTDVDVELGLRRKLYEVGAAPANAEMTSDAKRSTVRLSRKLKTDSLHPIDPTSLIDLIADVYRSASPVKKEAGA